jgi:hypothetical protein
MNVIYTPLEIDEAKALVSLALKEKRTPRAQAAFLIRQSLERLGLLSPIGLSSQQEAVHEHSR